MSLLRACRVRPTLNTLAYTRGLVTDSPFQAQVAVDKSESTQIAEPVHGEIFTADVISGAPGMHPVFVLALKPPIVRPQVSFVTARYASTSLPATPCKAALESRNAGALTGISSKVLVGGRTP